MTKQQLRETIRRVIKQELNEATFPKAGEKGYVKVSDLKKGDKLAGSNVEIISISSGVKTPSGKVEVTVKDLKTGKELTKTWNKSTTVRLKDKTDEAAPAPSKPAPTKEPAVAPGKPAEKKPRRPLGNPNVKPQPKATMKEANDLAKIVNRFRSKKKANEAIDLKPISGFESTEKLMKSVLDRLTTASQLQDWNLVDEVTSDIYNFINKI